MSYEAHSEEYRGMTIRIIADDDAQNPRKDCDPFGHMVCFHKRYNLGDEHSLSVAEAEALENRKDVISFPLYLYDHSGITLKIGPFDGAHAHWDSGRVGIVYATLAEIRDTFRVKRVTKRVREKAERALRCEVKTYDDYLTGNCWSYVIEGPDGEVLDSCCGFLGDYGAKGGCLEEARAVIDRDPERFAELIVLAAAGQDCTTTSCEEEVAL